MIPRKGDIVLYRYLDTRGEKIYGLVTKQAGPYSEVLTLWGETNGDNVFLNDCLRVVA